jgi:hypothetical protein
MSGILDDVGVSSSEPPRAPGAVRKAWRRASATLPRTATSWRPTASIDSMHRLPRYATPRRLGTPLKPPSSNPSKAARQIGSAANTVQTAYNQAAAHSQGREFVGKLFDQGAVRVGTSFVAGGPEADAAGALGDAGRMAEFAGDTSQAGELAGDTVKAADAGKATDMAGTALRTEVRNGYDYTLVGMGRTTRVQSELVSNPTQARNVAAQLEAGGADRLPTDEGGHFVVRRCNGPLDAFNHFARDMSLNRGAYKSPEDSWQRAGSGLLGRCHHQATLLGKLVEAAVVGRYLYDRWRALPEILSEPVRRALRRT